MAVASWQHSQEHVPNKVIAGEYYFVGRSVKESRVVFLVAIAISLRFHALAYGFTEGTDEPNDPYLIATADDLISI